MSTVLSKWGAGSPLPSSAAGEGQGLHSSLPPVARGSGGRASFSHPHYHMADEGGRISSPSLIPSGPLQQGHLYCVTQARCRACFPECCSQWRAGPVLPSAVASEDQGQLCAFLYFWPLVVTVALGINTDCGYGRTMVTFKVELNVFLLMIRL